MTPPAKPGLILACLIGSSAMALSAVGLAIVTENPLALWFAAPLLPVGGLALGPLRHRITKTPSPDAGA